MASVSVSVSLPETRGWRPTEGEPSSCGATDPPWPRTARTAPETRNTHTAWRRCATPATTSEQEEHRSRWKFTRRTTSLSTYRGKSTVKERRTAHVY